MSDTGISSATDELRKRWNATKPTKSQLEKAQYKVTEYRPTYPDATGWPAMRKLKLTFILGAMYLGFWAWYTMRVRDYYFQPNPYIDGFGFVAVIGLSGLALGMLWKLNEGTFADFRIILEPFLVLYRGSLRRSMLRIKKIRQIYPLAPDVEITAEDLAGKLSEPKKPDPKDKKKKGTTSTKTDPTVDTIKTAKTPTGEFLRPSSIQEMIELFQDILEEDPKPFQDNVDMAVELETRFVELVRSVGLDKFVNLADTPEYPAIFITDYPVESPTGDAKQIQFGFHDFFQKTYIWDKRNASSSSWGVCVHLEDFRFWKWNEGRKEYELLFAPIFYVAFSDGNLEDLYLQLWPKDRDAQRKLRPIEEARELAQHAKNAYTATLAEELIIRDKMHTGIIDAKDKEINQLQRQNTKGAKKIVAQGMRWMVLAGESMDDSGLDRLKAIFSKGAIKWLVILVAGVLVFLGFLLLLQFMTGIQFFDLPSGGGGDTYTDPTPYNPDSFLVDAFRMVIGK